VRELGQGLLDAGADFENVGSDLLRHADVYGKDGSLSDPPCVKTGG
jgi:hypothetical protein